MIISMDSGGDWHREALRKVCVEEELKGFQMIELDIGGGCSMPFPGVQWEGNVWVETKATLAPTVPHSPLGAFILSTWSQSSFINCSAKGAPMWLTHLFIISHCLVSWGVLGLGVLVGYPYPTPITHSFTLFPVAIELANDPF